LVPGASYWLTQETRGNTTNEGGAIIVALDVMHVGKETF